jgi:DNA-binding response OmpR family regulator
MSHVLIVDADRRLRSAYSRALEAEDHVVAQAASAQAAIGACEDKKPDIIVLELQLQGHSGVEFLQELRSYPEWNAVPVLLHTFVPRESLQNFDQAFKTYGIVGYTYKPDTSLKKLVSLVEETLQAKV